MVSVSHLMSEIKRVTTHSVSVTRKTKNTQIFLITAINSLKEVTLQRNATKHNLTKSCFFSKPINPETCMINIIISDYHTSQNVRRCTINISVETVAF